MNFKEFNLIVYKTAETEADPKILAEIANITNENEKKGNNLSRRKPGQNDKTRTKPLYTHRAKYPEVLVQGNIYTGVAGNIHARKKGKISVPEYEKQRNEYIEQLAEISPTPLDKHITLEQIEVLSEKRGWWEG